jgi:metal-dependent amidase/aminoacylase/carboxypeptidase family protein
MYAELRTDEDMAALWRANAAALGRESIPIQPSDGYASTDMGNVSYAIPTIHPLIALETDGANIHETAFAEFAAAPTGDKAVLDGAVAMVWTTIDIAYDEGLRKRLLAKTFFVADVDRDARWLDLDYDSEITYP